MITHPTLWELPRVFFKPYPANHFTHAGIDATIKLREEGLDVEEIEEIEFGAATTVLRTIAQPEDEKTRPKTGYAAKFSARSPSRPRSSAVGPRCFSGRLHGRGRAGPRQARPRLPRPVRDRRGVRPHLPEPVPRGAARPAQKRRDAGGARLPQPRRAGEPFERRGTGGKVPHQHRTRPTRRSSGRVSGHAERARQIRQPRRRSTAGTSRAERVRTRRGTTSDVSLSGPPRRSVGGRCPRTSRRRRRRSVPRTR